ncbi:hypothetical protein KKD71_00635 [Patescibacteria group bacterium]|nr:hypothetical protein [Patescibacteria group bacterium]
MTDYHENLVIDAEGVEDYPLKRRLFIDQQKKFRFGWYFAVIGMIIGSASFSSCICFECKQKSRTELVDQGCAEQEVTKHWQEMDGPVAEFFGYDGARDIEIAALWMVSVALGGLLGALFGTGLGIATGFRIVDVPVPIEDNNPEIIRGFNDNRHRWIHWTGEHISGVGFDQATDQIVVQLMGGSVIGIDRVTGPPSLVRREADWPVLKQQNFNSYEDQGWQWLSNASRLTCTRDGEEVWHRKLAKAAMNEIPLSAVSTFGNHSVWINRPQPIDYQHVYFVGKYMVVLCNKTRPSILIYNRWSGKHVSSYQRPEHDNVTPCTPSFMSLNDDPDSFVIVCPFSDGYVAVIEPENKLRHRQFDLTTEGCSLPWTVHYQDGYMIVSGDSWITCYKTGPMTPSQTRFS